MKNERPKKSSDRRRGQRYDTSIPIQIRFQADGSPVEGSATEISPNGMRVVTALPLVEAAYVHIAFSTASNGTHAEGRVVWTQRLSDNIRFESGIDIQRWGNGVPNNDPTHVIPDLKPKPDRRAKPR